MFKAQLKHVFEKKKKRKRKDKTVTNIIYVSVSLNIFHVHSCDYSIL